VRRSNRDGKNTPLNLKVCSIWREGVTRQSS
jgi:hypothetical protein